MKKQSPSHNPLIVALDVSSLAEARRFVKLLKKEISFFKIGLELFTTCGPDVIQMVHDEGGRVFLDLKFHDIPNTVRKACEAAARWKVFMLNVHASGGFKMMQEASRARELHTELILLGVTVLTSEASQSDTSTRVLNLAQESQKAGLQGVVCSALEAAAVRTACGSDFVIVTPGVRPSNVLRNDQERVMTPSQAIQSGSNYLVIGRPILEAADPVEAVRQIQRQIVS